MNPKSVSAKTTLSAWGLALSPLLIPALLMAAALHLRLQLGHWAVPMVDGDYGHDAVFFGVIALAVLPAIPFWMIILFSSMKGVGLWQRLFLGVTYVACWFLSLAYCRIDPWRYIEWYLD